MAYIPLTGQSSNPFAQIPDGITPGTKVKVVATGYRSGEPNVILESDPVTILSSTQTQGYFEKNYPITKLLAEIEAAEPGSTIDLQGKVYWLNNQEAAGEDGITYPPYSDYCTYENNYYIRKSIELKNGTIILFEECSDLVDEGGGIFSASYNPEARTIVQVFDPGENNYFATPRLAKYPPQPTGILTTYTVDGGSFVFGTNPTKPQYSGSMIRSAVGSCPNCSLDGFFIDKSGITGASLASEIETILDEVVSDEGFSNRTEAAVGMGILYRRVPNEISITKIETYEENANGITIGFEDSFVIQNGNDHYLNSFNFFGYKTFMQYGDGPAEGVSSFSTSKTEGKIYYKPANGNCLQLWKSIDGYVNNVGGITKGGYSNGFMVITGTGQYDPDTNTFPDSITFDNITVLGNASMENTGRSAILYTVASNTPANISLLNCTFYSGYSTLAQFGGNLLIDNTAILFPLYSSMGINCFGDKVIKNSRIIGCQQKSGIYSGNHDGKPLTGYITVTGNYFNLASSNHGQAISMYGTTWPRYRVYGNIFHNCQRSISLQAGDWTETDFDLYLNGNELGPGLVYANNIIYHDLNPAYYLSGQNGWAYNGLSPQQSLYITVDDPTNQYNFNSDQVSNFVIQRFNGTSFEDKNFADDVGKTAADGDEVYINLSLQDPTVPSWQSDSSLLNDGVYDYDYSDEVETTAYESERNYFTGNRSFKVRRNSDYRSNIFLGAIVNSEEQLYLRTVPIDGHEEHTYQGIKVLNIQFTKPSPPIEVFRNNIMAGYSYANYMTENDDPYNVSNAFGLSFLGSQDILDTNNDGTNDFYPKRPGSNGPLSVYNNIFYSMGGVGYSGGDVDSPNYEADARRLYGGVTVQDNIIMKPESTWGGLEGVYNADNRLLSDEIDSYTYIQGITYLFDDWNTGNPTPKSEFSDMGILWTTNGLPSGTPIYPDFRNIKNIDLNWSDVYKPVHPDLLRGEQTTETITYSITHPNYNTKFQTDEYSWTLTSETPIVQGTFLDGTPWVLDTGSLKLINVSPRQKTIETNEGTGLINRTVINLDGSKFYGDLQYSGISYGDKRVSVRASDNTDFSPLFMLHPFDYRAGFDGDPIDDAAILNKIITVSTNNNFVVDGIETPTLDVIRTKTYNFDQSDESNLNRQLKISTDSNGTNLFSGYSYTGTAGQDGVASVSIPSDLSITDLYYFTDGVGTTGGKLSINRIGKGYDSSQGIDFSDPNGYTLESGDMVITSTSYEGNLTKYRDPYIESYGCLTVVSEIPPSNAFRPPVNWDPNDKANRPIFTENDTFSNDLLTYPNYSLSSDEFIDFSSDSDISLDQVSRYGTITPYYIGKDGSSYDGTIKSLDQINREYGGYQAISEEKLMLCVFDPQTDVNVRNTARRVVAQRGIDTFGAYYSLGKHAVHNGYINGEYNPRVFFAWAVCGDSRMFDVLNFTVGNTYNGTYKEYDYTGDKLGLGLLPTYHETRQGTLNCNLCSHRHFDIPIVETGNIENENYVIVSRPSRMNDLTAEQSPPLHLSSIYTGAYETWGWANNVTIPGKEIISSYIRLKSEGNPDKITRIVNAEAIIGNGVDKDPEFFKLFLQDNIIDGTETVCDISNALEETRSNLLTRIISGGLSNTSTEAAVYAYTYSVISHILSNFLISKSKGGRDFVPKWAQYQIDKAIWFTSTYPGKTALIQNGNSTYNLGMKSSTDRFTTDSLYYALCRQEIAQGVKLNEVPGENDLVFTDPTVWYDLPETKTWEELTYPAGNIIYYTRSLASTNNPAPLYNYSDNSYYRRTKYFFSYQREEDAKIVFEMWSRFTNEDSIPWGNIKDLKLYSWVSGALSPVGLTLESTTATDDADIDWKAYWVYDDPEIYYTSTEVSILFVDQS